MVVLPIAVLAAVVGLVVALMRRVVVTVGVNEHSGVVEVARHTRRWRVAGLLLGGVTAVLLVTLGASGSTPSAGSRRSPRPPSAPASSSARSRVS